MQPEAPPGSSATAINVCCLIFGGNVDPLVYASILHSAHQCAVNWFRCRPKGYEDADPSKADRDRHRSEREFPLAAGPTAIARLAATMKSIMIAKAR
jgi:hypothetical protein